MDEALASEEVPECSHQLQYGRHGQASRINRMSRSFMYLRTEEQRSIRASSDMAESLRMQIARLDRADLIYISAYNSFIPVRADCQSYRHSTARKWIRAVAARIYLLDVPRARSVALRKLRVSDGDNGSLRHRAIHRWGGKETCFVGHPMCWIF